MIRIVVGFFLLLFCSCTTGGNPEEILSTINLDVSKDVLSIDSFPEISVKDYGFASFITPNTKNEMDTLTIPLDGYLSDCTIKTNSFFCHTVEENCILRPRTLDTVFINYGEKKITDYLPYYEVPNFDTNAVRKSFSAVRFFGSKALSDTIVSSYKLSQKGLPAGIDLKYVLQSSELYVTDPCAVRIEYPHLNKYSYQLQKLDDAQVVKDSTFFWTLFYMDQYGRGDSLDMKTKFH